MIPLAAAGNHVIAVERDSVAPHGGEVRLPGGERVTPVPGLVDRLKREELHDRVRIVEGDFLRITEVQDMISDAVWTSCSWHYSANHNRPLADFAERTKRLVRPGGLFRAEFMMPVEPHHRFAAQPTGDDASFPLASAEQMTGYPVRPGTFPRAGADHDQRRGPTISHQGRLAIAVTGTTETAFHRFRPGDPGRGGEQGRGDGA